MTKIWSDKIGIYLAKALLVPQRVFDVHVKCPSERCLSQKSASNNSIANVCISSPAPRAFDGSAIFSWSTSMTSSTSGAFAPEGLALVARGVLFRSKTQTLTIQNIKIQGTVMPLSKLLKSPNYYRGYFQNQNKTTYEIIH